jgi:hypothetical protein
MPAGVDDGLIVGFQHEECVIMRESDEPLEFLQNRANAAVVSSALTRIWRPLVAKSDEQTLLDSP